MSDEEVLLNSNYESYDECCNSLDTYTGITTRKYIPNFENYYLKDCSDYNLYIIKNNNFNNKKIYNLDYYKFYSAINTDNIIDIDNITDTITNTITDDKYFLLFENIVKLEPVGNITLKLYKKHMLLCSTSINYKLNDPQFNNDVIEIKKYKYNIYIYLERENKNTLFYIKKIILVNNILL